MLELPLPKPSIRITQLERPQKVARLLEIGPHGHDLVHQILHADDAQFPQLLLDQRVIGERDALFVDLAVAALVDQVAHGLGGGVPVGDVGFHDLEHFGGRFGEPDEDPVIDLEEPQQLEDLAGFGGDFVDTGGWVCG